jgi:hypothetical protein
VTLWRWHYWYSGSFGQPTPFRHSGRGKADAFAIARQAVVAFP